MELLLKNLDRNMKLGLSRIKKILKKWKNPQNNYKVIFMASAVSVSWSMIFSFSVICLVKIDFFYKFYYKIKKYTNFIIYFFQLYSIYCFIILC